jgi:hypothetical protein
MNLMQKNHKFLIKNGVSGRFIGKNKFLKKISFPPGQF